jgi:hypothetical protein
LGLVWGLWASTGASAQTPAGLPLELSWSAPNECPTASDVQSELARIASAAPGEDLRPLSARISVEHSGPKYTANVHTEHEGLTGERTLQAQDCPTLVRSVTLVLALAFGRSVELHDDASPSTAPPDTAPPAKTAEPEAKTAEPKAKTAEPEAKTESDEHDEPSTPSELHVGLLLGGGGQLTLLPAVAPLARVGAELKLRALSVELRADVIPMLAASKIDTDASARFDAVVVTALACGNYAFAALCGGARAGGIHARTHGLTRDDSATAPWYALAVATSVSLPEHSSFQISVEGQLAISLNRPRFAVTGLAETHRVPVLAPELSVFMRYWP